MIFQAIVRGNPSISILIFIIILYMQHLRQRRKRQVRLTPEIKVRLACLFYSLVCGVHNEFKTTLSSTQKIAVNAKNIMAFQKHCLKKENA